MCCAWFATAFDETLDCLRAHGAKLVTPLLMSFLFPWHPIGQQGYLTFGLRLVVIASVGSDERGTGGMQRHGVIEGIEKVMLVPYGQLQRGGINLRGIKDAMLDVAQIEQVVLGLIGFQACQNGCNFGHEVRRLDQF